MNNMLTLLKYIPFVFLVAIISYSIGHLFFSLSKGHIDNKNLFTFVKTLVGYLIAVVIYAVIKAGFNTVFLGSIPLFIYYSRSLRDERGRKSFGSYCAQGVADLPRLVVLVVFAALATLPWLSKLNSCFAGGDYLFYSGIADAFNRFGVESPYGLTAQFLPAIHQATFYHYGDIIGAAFLGWLLSVPSSVAYIYVMLPFLAGLAVFGLYSWYECLSIHRLKWIVAAIVLSITGFAFRTVLESPKLMIVGVFMVWFLVNYDKGKSITQRCYPLVLLSFFYQTVMPVIVPALLMLCISLHVFNSRRGCHRVDWMMPCYVMLWFGTFYIANNIMYAIPSVEKMAPASTVTLNYLSHIPNMFGQFMLCARYTGGLVLYAVGILVLLGYLCVKTGAKAFVVAHIEEILFLMFVLLGGYGGVCLFPYSLERGQLIMNFFRPFCDILMVMICGYLLSQKRITLTIALLLTSFLYCDTFSRVYLVPKSMAEINEQEILLQKHMTARTYKSCYIRTPTMETIPASTLALVRIPFSAVRQTSKSFFPECLSIDENVPDPSVPAYNNIIPPSDYFDRSVQQFMNASPFWRFYRACESGTDIVTAQSYYIQRNKIDYLLVQKGSDFLRLVHKFPVKVHRQLGDDWHFFSFEWTM